MSKYQRDDALRAIIDTRITEIMSRYGRGVIPGTTASNIAPIPVAGSAPLNAQYLALAVDATLTAERVFTAGAGLTGTDSGAGAAYTLALTTPGTLTVSTTNTASGSHTHAVTSSSNPGANARLLATDASGYLSLVRLTATDRLVSPLITSASGNITLTPAGTNVILTDSRAISTTTFASGFTGSGFRIDQGISYASQTTAEFDNLVVRGLMRVYELVINKIRVSRGSLIVSPGGGKVRAVTSLGGSSYAIDFEDDHGLAVNDLMRAQKFTGSGTYQSLMTVTSVGGAQTATVTLNSGSAPAVGYEYAVTGNTSNTSRQGLVYLTADDSNAPFIDIVDGLDAHSDWGSSAVARTRLGRLSGITDSFFGTLTGYGLYASRGYLNGVRVNGSIVVGPGVGFSVAPSIYLPLDAPADYSALNTNGHRGQAPTVSGTMTITRGLFGAAGVVANNLVTYASFEDGTTGWTHTEDGSGSAAADTTYVYSGRKSYAITRTGGTYAYSYSSALITGITGDTLYTLRAAVTKATGGSSRAAVVVWWYNSSDTFLSSSSLLWPTGTHDWQVRSGVVTAPATATKFRIVVSVEDGDGAAFFDNISLCKTDSGTLTYTSVNNIRGDLGTISVWLEVPANVISGLTDWQYVMNYGAFSGGGTNQWLALYLSNNSGDALRFGYSNGNGYVTTLDADITSMLASPGWHHIAVTYGPTNGQVVYIDGVAAASTTFTGTPFAAPTGYSTFTVGPNGAFAMSDLAIIYRELSADDIEAIARSGERLNVARSNYELVLSDYNSGRVNANAGGIFGTDTSGKPTFTLLNSAATVNGESLGAGDTLLGDNTASKGNVLFDQSAGTLNIRTGTTNVLSFGSTGSVDGVLNLGASGGIWQGSSGTFSSPNTGLKLYRNASDGWIELWKSGEIVASITPDYAFSIQASPGFANSRALNFFDDFGNRVGETYGYTTGSSSVTVALRARTTSASITPSAYTFSGVENSTGGVAKSWSGYTCGRIADNGDGTYIIYSPRSYSYSEADYPNDKALWYAYAISADETAYIELISDDAATSAKISADTFSVVGGGSKGFQIDHPLHPLTKWLHHAAIESDERRNIYGGIVTLDGAGEAVVTMPDWFNAISRDAVPIVTALDMPAPNLHTTARDISRSVLTPYAFEIRGGNPGQRIAWQMMTTRDDQYARRHPYVVEEDKNGEDVGYVSKAKAFGRRPQFRERRSFSSPPGHEVKRRNETI